MHPQVERHEYENFTHYEWRVDDGMKILSGYVVMGMGMGMGMSMGIGEGNTTFLPRLSKRL